MTTTSHLNALERRHASLDEEILLELQRPAQDELKIGMLKRKKTRTKRRDIANAESNATIGENRKFF